MTRAWRLGSGIALASVLGLTGLASVRVHGRGVEKCLAEGKSRQEGNFKYIAFANSCALEAPLRVCGIYDEERSVSVVGDNVPARGSSEVKLANWSGRRLSRYVWIEGTQNPCPRTVEGRRAATAATTR